MNRIRRGLHFARESWRVLRADRSLIVFPIVSIVSAVVAFNALAIVGVGIAAASHVAWLVLIGFAAGAYAGIYCAVFCSVALVGAVQLSLSGHDSHFSDGLAVAKKRRRVIAQWAAVQLAVGLVASALERSRAGGLAGALVGSIVGVAWSVATFFVVPVIALEGLGPKAALRRSASLVEAKWGEGLTGSTAIGLVVFLVAAGPVFGLFFAAGALGSSAFATVLSLVAFTVMIAACAIGSTLTAILRVELYRYSRDEKPTGRFSGPDLDAAFLSA